MSRKSKRFWIASKPRPATDQNRTKTAPPGVCRHPAVRLYTWWETPDGKARPVGQYQPGDEMGVGCTACGEILRGAGSKEAPET